MRSFIAPFTITLLQLEAFVAVVDLGSFKAAAAHVGIAQSAISRHVSALENRFSSPLFDRSGRSAQLTDHGMDVLSKVRTILSQRDILIDQFVAPERLSRQLRIGVTEMAALTWLPALMDALRSTYPKVHFEFEVASNALDLYEKVAQGRFELALVPDSGHYPTLLRFPMGVLDCGWYASSAIHIPRSCTIEQLAQFPVLVQEADSATGNVVSAWLQQHNVQPPELLTSNSFAALGGMTTAGLGVGYLPLAVARELSIMGAVREISVFPPTPGTYYVAVMRSELSPPLTRHVISLARQLCNYNQRYQDSNSAWIAKDQTSC